MEDAVTLGLHYILKHLYSPGTYTKMLFVDFSSVFNTIITEVLLTKVTQPTAVDHKLPDRQEVADEAGRNNPAPGQSALGLLKDACSVHCSFPPTP